jgi:hypothetical protein
MAEPAPVVARPQVRWLLLLMACLLGVSTLVARSREAKPPAPTGLRVPAEVRVSAPLRIGGHALECQEVRLTQERRGVRVYSRDASLSNTWGGNLEFWVDVQLRVDGRTVSGTVLGTPDDPFTIGTGVTTTGVFGGTPPLHSSQGVRTALVNSAGRPAQVAAGALRGCAVSFVAVRPFSS